MTFYTKKQPMETHMIRSVSFGIGVTLTFIGLSIFYWINSMDPGGNAVAAMLMGSILMCPGSILLGRSMWPPEQKQPICCFVST